MLALRDDVQFWTVAKEHQLVVENSSISQMFVSLYTSLRGHIHELMNLTNNSISFTQDLETIPMS
jgi:hypothetical protein